MRIKRTHQTQWACSNSFYLKVPMPKLLIAQMLNKRLKVWMETCYKNSNVEICILLQPQSEVISFSENLDSVWNIAHSTNKLLVRGRCCSSASNFPVKASSCHETDTKLISSLGIGSSNWPNHVTGGISHSLTNWISSFFLFEKERVSHQLVDLREFFWWNQISSDKLSNSQTNSVLQLWWRG